MSGGSDQPAPTQTTTYTPSPEQRQLLQLAMPGVTSFAGSVPQQYQGTTVTPFDPSQVQGQNMALQAASSQTPLAQQGAELSGGWLSADPNARRDSTIRAVTDPLYERLTEQALPAVKQGAIEAGGLGGSREGIAQGQAIRDTQRLASDAASKVSTDIYGTDVKAQLQALGLEPQTLQALLTGATTTSGVGDVRQAMEQAQNADLQQRYLYDQYAPFLQSRDILSLMGSMPTGTTVATGSTPTSTNPTATQTLGGAAAGATLGTAIMPGVGTAAGAAGGALVPWLFR